MEIRQLRAFIAVAETGTFTSGARRVHVTQAAISMQIRQFEREIGTPLFIRTPRCVVLTHAGEVLLEAARRILREHDAATAELTDLAGAEKGRLRVGSASASVSAESLPHILKELCERHPRADVFVSTGTSESLVGRLLAGELDIALISLPVEARGIRTELLLRDALVAIVSPRHQLAQQRVVSAYVLAAEKLILGERGGNTRRMIDHFFAEAGVRPVVSMEMNRLAAIKQMVEKDMGVGIVPSQSVKEEVDESRLVALWIEGAQINWELGLARLSRCYDSPVMQTFMSLCQSYFGSAAEDVPRGAKVPRSKSRKKRRVNAR